MRRPVLFLMAITLVAASCTGGDAETTTSTEASTTSTTATTVPETTTTSSTTTTTTPSSPVIAREGDENEIVATLQLLLECRGYGDLTLDGKGEDLTEDLFGRGADQGLGFLDRHQGEIPRT